MKAFHVEFGAQDHGIADLLCGTLGIVAAKRRRPFQSDMGGFMGELEHYLPIELKKPVEGRSQMRFPSFG